MNPTRRYIVHSFSGSRIIIDAPSRMAALIKFFSVKAHPNILIMPLE
jgi:hypothetical protein